MNKAIRHEEDVTRFAAGGRRLLRLLGSARTGTFLIGPHYLSRPSLMRSCFTRFLANNKEHEARLKQQDRRMAQQDRRLQAQDGRLQSQDGRLVQQDNRLQLHEVRIGQVEDQLRKAEVSAPPASETSRR